MKRHSLMTGAMLVLVGALVQPADAQRGPPRGQGLRDGGPRMGSVVERALALREGLDLDEQQVEQLNTLRFELLAEREAALSERLLLQSDLNAGEITSADYREALRQRPEGMEERRDQVQDRLSEVLTEGQMDELSAAGRDGLRRGGRGSSARGRGGFRGRGPGFDRGRRGPGRRGPSNFRRGGFGRFP